MAGQNQHVIGDLQFQLQFHSQQAALGQQSDITTFIKQELLPQADKIFAEMAAGEETIRLDKLEIDLGKIPYESVRTDMAQRFTKMLREALIDLLSASPSKATTAVQRLSSAEAEFQAVTQFLSTGRLSWQALSGDKTGFDALLLRVLKSHTAGIVAFLHQTGTNEALNRLIAQTPLPGLVILLGPVMPMSPEELTELVRRVDALAGSASTPAGAPKRIWSAVFRRLFGLHAPTHSQTIAAVETALAAENINPSGLSASSRHKRDYSVSHSIESLIGLISGDRFEELLQDWPALIGPQRRSFATALRRALHQKSARHRLVSALSEECLADIVTILTPDSGPWITRLVGQLQDIRRRTAAQQEPAGGPLWELSISYLLAQRGSQFNKLSYLESLLRRMAAHDNRDYAALLQTIASLITESVMPTALRIELVDMLETLTERDATSRSLAGSPPGKPLTTTSPEPTEQFVDSLVTLIRWGRIGELTQNWAVLIGPRRRPFAAALRRALRRQIARDRLVSALGKERLRDIVIVLAPEAGAWIATIVAQPQLFQIGPQRTPKALKRLGARLWEYAVAHLVVDRGDRLDKQAFIESLLQQLAGDDELYFATSLEMVAKQVAESGLLLPLRTELGDLLDTIIQRESATHNRQLITAETAMTGPQAGSAKLDVESITAFIRSSRFDALMRHWSEITGPRRAQFATALRGTLHRRRARRRLVFALSDTQLTDIVTVLSPEAGEWIACMVGEPRILTTTADAAQESKRSFSTRLWDYSIAYLVVDRGSRFNKLAYMESLLRQMAAHDNIYYATLLESFAAMLARSEILYGVANEIGEIVRILAERETTLKTSALKRRTMPGLAALDTIDILRDFAAGMPPALDRDQLRKLLEQLHAGQPLYLRRLLHELRNGRELGRELPGIDALIDELEAAAAVQRKIRAAAGASQTQDLSAVSRPQPGAEEAPRKDSDNSLAEHDISATYEIRPTESQRTEPTPMQATVSEDEVGRSPLTDTNLALMPALTRLKQVLSLWPEHLLALLWTDELLRRAGASDRLSLRSVMQAFMTGLSAMNAVTIDGAVALLEQLAAASGKSSRFWQHELVVFSRRYDAATASQLKQTAALRLQSLVLPPTQVQPAKHYANIENRFDQLMGAVSTQPDPTALRELRSMFERERDTLYLINRLGERSLARALEKLLPSDYPAIRYLAEVFAAAALFPNSYLTARAVRRLIWHGLFDWLIGQKQPFAAPTLARDLTTRLLYVVRIDDAGELLSRLRARLPQAARQQDWLSDLNPDHLLTSGQTDEAEPEGGTDADEDIEFKDEVFIANAGLVLLAPFLPRLFKMLGLIEDDAFVDAAAAERAALLLQFALTDSDDAPEYQLALNKLLCGIRPGVPLARNIDVSAFERETIDGLLKAIIEHWGSIGNTSVAGLRSEFLQRDGRLRLIDSGWHLLVETRAFDLLMDSLPWSYKLIKFPWMDKVLHVEWR